MRGEEEWNELEAAYMEATKEGSLSQQRWRASLREKTTIEHALLQLQEKHVCTVCGMFPVLLGGVCVLCA